MSELFLHSLAHSSQISAHNAHAFAENWLFEDNILATAKHISAQSIRIEFRCPLPLW